MLAGYDAKAVSNFILSEWDARANKISNKKLNKLLFLSHGFCLLRTGQPLVRNHFEAWEHGPVVRAVYHEFKRFGYNPITDYARAFNYVTGRNEVCRCEITSSLFARPFHHVVSHYIQFSADELERMTHEPGSPWCLTRNGNQGGLGGRIPNHLILESFRKDFGGDIH